MLKFMRLMLGGVLMTCTPLLQAQQLGLEYNAELQTNFRDGYNFANLLRINGSMDLCDNLSIQASTISIARSNSGPLVDDLQGYSNIDAENLTLGIAVLGFEYHKGRSTFSLGIRNVGEDFFTSPATSLFINSSCGIFPSISCNHEIANYPLSSWCFHYMAELDEITLQTSLYDGQGHSRIAGHDNVFDFSPRRDGIFSITSIEYCNNGSNYSLGCALHYGLHDSYVVFSDEKPETFETTPQAQKSLSFTPWLNAEHKITSGCSILLQASFATAKTNCKYYLSAGCIYKIGCAYLSLLSNYARYDGVGESVTELTYLIPLTQIISIQPSIEVIRTGHQTNAIGIARFIVNL